MAKEPTTPDMKKIILVSEDAGFVQNTKSAFAASDAIELQAIDKSPSSLGNDLYGEEPGVIILDVDARQPEQLEAVQSIVRRQESRTPVVVITENFTADVVRQFVRMRITDFLVKPVTTADIVRACLRALQGGDETDQMEAQIQTFMPTAGGVGATTLTLQTAFMLHKAAIPGRSSTCVVDLNFQHGSCAEYLDLEPRFDITEIENNPERLDRQLLDVMLSKHESGLAVVAAPNVPTEMRTFDAKLVIRLLDLVSAYFDNVVIDLPRTWFPWTETVIMGSNQLYLVSEMTVPCLRQTKRMIGAIEERVSKSVRPQVIVNRFEQRRFEGGTKEADVQAMLGDNYAGGIANNYKLVREAVDRGIPLEEIQANSNVVSDLRRIVMPEGVLTTKKQLSLPLPKFMRKAS